MAVNYQTSDVRPLIPDAQRNLAPEILSRGLAALAQMNVAREKMQLESEQMATDAALKSRQLTIERENNVWDFQVGMANANRITKFNQDRSDAKVEEHQNFFDHITQLENAKTDYLQRKQELDINNPAPGDIRTFVGNSLQLAHEFRNYDIPEVRRDIKEVVVRAKKIQGKIPLRYGAVKEGDEWEGGTTKAFTAAEIVSGLADPFTQDAMANALEATGLMKNWKTEEHNFTAAERGPDVKGPDVKGTILTAPSYLRDWANGVPTPTGTPRPSISSRMSMWEKKNRPVNAPETVSDQPSITTESVDEAAATMATEAGQSVSTPPNVFDTSKTDKLIESYNRHKDEPGFNIEGAKQFLIANGVDLSQIE